MSPVWEYGVTHCNHRQTLSSAHVPLKSKHTLQKSEEKTPVGRPRQRWDNIKMDMKEIGSEVYLSFIVH
jgi:hypothetical protein